MFVDTTVSVDAKSKASPSVLGAKLELSESDTSTLLLPSDNNTPKALLANKLPEEGTLPLYLVAVGVIISASNLREVSDALALCTRERAL